MILRMVRSRIAALAFGVVAAASCTPAAVGQNVEDLVKAGRDKAAQKEFKAALGFLDSAVAKAPNDIEARRWRGLVNTALGLHQKAVEDLTVAVRLNPSASWAWYARGMAHHHLKKFSVAIEDYSRAFRLDPKGHKAVEWRGYTRAQIGDHLGAYVDFCDGVSLDPKNPWVYFARGKSALALGSMDRALDDFRRVLKLDPKHPGAHAQLGFVLAARGENKTALTHLEKAVELDSRGQDYARLFRYWLRSSLGKMSRYPIYDLPDRGWTGDLARVLAGGLTPASAIQRATTYGINDSGFKSRRCEVFFYLGLRFRLLGRANKAQDYFRQALVRGDGTIPEWHVARYLARK